jgi:PAS domain S-box-containing protein
MPTMAETVPTHPGLEALPDGFCMIDAEGRVVYWNGAAARMLSIPREQALGRKVWDVVPASLRGVMEPHLDMALRRRAEAEFVTPHPPGCCPGFYAMRAVPLEEGGVALHFRDTTRETKLADQFARLLESIRDGFLAVDPDGSIGYINHVAERLLRLHRSKALGMQIWDLVPSRPEEIAAALRATLADGTPRNLRRIRPDAPVFRDHLFDLWIHPLPGGGLSILFQDVTRRVQREKDLSRYAAEADEANRAKARFFAAVSHELRTPLNAIVGYTHLLTTQTYGTLPDSAVRAASRASVCAEHLSQLVDDLLLMTTVEIDRVPVTPVPLPLGRFLPAVLEPVRQQAEAKGLVFRIEVPADAPVVETDPDRLRQLLHALVSNAVKFTHRGGIEIRAEALAPADAAVQNPGTAQGSAAGGEVESGPPASLRIRISDTGPGIPAEARERIFEAFEQLGDASRSDSLRRGTGLGLTVARRLTRLLQGTLTLEATSAAGSVFAIDLPPRLILRDERAGRLDDE